MSESWVFTSTGEEATERLGTRLASVLEPNTVVALVGDLGAGKTRLVRAVAAALGVDPKTVTSPTFTLIHEYEARWPIYHIDAYRLRDADEFLELGTDEILQGGGVCLIEWADRVAEALPADALRVEIEVTGETSRKFHVSGSGENSMAIVKRLRQVPAEGPRDV